MMNRNQPKSAAPAITYLNVFTVAKGNRVVTAFAGERRRTMFGYSSRLQHRTASRRDRCGPYSCRWLKKRLCCALGLPSAQSG